MFYLTTHSTHFIYGYMTSDTATKSKNLPIPQLSPLNPELLNLPIPQLSPLDPELLNRPIPQLSPLNPE